MTDIRKNKGQSQEPISDELFLKYIKNEVSSEEKWEIEKKLNESLLLSDAEEGLQLFAEKKELSEMASAINRKVKQRLQKRNWRSRQNPPRLYLILIVTIIFLLLLTLTFWIIYQLKKG